MFKKEQVLHFLYLFCEQFTDVSSVGMNADGVGMNADSRLQLLVITFF